MKKMLLTLALGAVAAGSFSAAAITPQELNGRPVLQMFWGSSYQMKAPVLTSSGTFRYEGGQLYIDGFRGRYTLPVTFDQSAQTLILPLQSSFKGEANTLHNTAVLGAVQGKNMSIHNEYGYLNGKLVLAQVGTTINQYPATCYQVQTNYTSCQTTPYSTTPYSYVNLPNFVIDKSAAVLSIGMLNSSYSSVSLSSPRSNDAFAIYSKIAFYVMNPTNTHATDALGREYDCEVAFATDSDNKLQFPNLFLSGIPYNYNFTGVNLKSYEFKWLTGNVDRESGKITVEACYSGGVVVPYYKGYMTYQSGTYNTYRGYSNFSSPIYWTGYWFTDQTVMFPEQLFGKELAGDEISDVEGTFEVKNVYHDYPENHGWAHTAGGQLHTYEDWSVDFGTARFYSEAITLDGNYALEKQIDWTNLDVNRIDVTHHCQFANVEPMYGENNNDNNEMYIYVRGNIEQVKHNHHVDVAGYEYYLIPGTYTTPSGEAFNHANGHVDALNVTSYATSFNPTLTRAAAEDADPTAFRLLVPERAFTEAGITPSADHKYTLFAKAKYATPGLEDTFHALTPLTPVITGIDSAIAESDITIEALNGAIEVKGAGNVEVYTAAGVEVYRGTAGSIAVEPGLYIVRADGKVSKLTVR